MLHLPGSSEYWSPMEKQHSRLGWRHLLDRSRRRKNWIRNYHLILPHTWNLSNNSYAQINVRKYVCTLKSYCKWSKLFWPCKNTSGLFHKSIAFCIAQFIVNIVNITTIHPLERISLQNILQHLHICWILIHRSIRGITPELFISNETKVTIKNQIY